MDIFDNKVSFCQKQYIKMSPVFLLLQSVHQDASFSKVSALPQGDGLVKNGFQSFLLGPYGISHTNKSEGKTIPKFGFYTPPYYSTFLGMRNQGEINN